MVSCTKKDTGGKPSVSLWASGSDNVRIVFEKLVAEFNSNPEFNQKCTVTLQFMPTGGGTQTIHSRLLAAYKTGQKGTDFDIVEVGTDEVGPYLDEGGPDMFIRYDASKIPNLSGVSARPPLGPEYFIPYRGTTVVIAYNSEAVPNPPKTLDDLTKWIKEHPGRFAYNALGTGGAGDSWARSAIYNFLPEEAFMDNNLRWASQWDQGFAYLKEIHPYMYKSSGKVVYPNKNQGTLDLLASKEIDMCPAWADMSLSQIKNGTLPASIKIYQIQPSLTGSLNSLGITSFGSYPEESYSFINFMLSPTAQNILLSEMAAIPLIDGSRLNANEAAVVKDLDVTKFRTQSIGSLSTNLNQRWNDTIATLP
jgi:putative spermidine/putrescine transport system substrate-binding protein